MHTNPFCHFLSIYLSIYLHISRIPFVSISFLSFLSQISYSFSKLSFSLIPFFIYFLIFCYLSITFIPLFSFLFLFCHFLASFLSFYHSSSSLSLSVISSFFLLLSVNFSTFLSPSVIISPLLSLSVDLSTFSALSSIKGKRTAAFTNKQMPDKLE
ncbi:unnamed protein product [Acanthosepion pharaonis]|uniref:Uncharacterized protein n=1 Tax=Acanthosepion pharaonis TaxID=158019 RepID=A0A812CF39_ACAPH|nr:unnamed protein product [Sepia pharaonis]